MIAEARKYLLASSGQRGMALIFEEGVTYEERDIPDTLTHIVGDTFNLGGVFAVTLSDDTKKRLVGNLFTNDDQIAIILNKDNSDMDATIFDLMQSWRNYFSEIISKMRNYER